MEYVIVKKLLIGKGSHGKVYLAKFRGGGGGLLAVKSAVCSVTSSFLLREEEIIRSLGACPHVVQCFGGYYSAMEDDDDDDDDSWVYNLVLEYAPGGTLKDLMDARGGKLPEQEARDYTRMILRGLRYMHDKGVVHCDLKPENVLVFPRTGGGHSVKIADFGLAKTEGEEESGKARVRVRFRGTPAYMSPEALDSKQHGPPSDIWALGCALIRMVTGKSVWAGCRIVGGMVNHVVAGKQSPEVPECLSESGKDFLRKCMERDPKLRWTAEMLLDHPFMGCFPSSAIRICSWSDSERDLYCRMGRYLVSLFPPGPPLLNPGKSLVSNLCLGQGLEVNYKLVKLWMLLFFIATSCILLCKN